MFFVTNSTKQKYCNAHNITFMKETIPREYDRHPAWYKIKFVLQLLETYDTLMYIDADAGFVNFTNNLNEYLNTSFDIALCKTDERT